MEKQQPKFKVLMFPWLAHGHISPFLQLSKSLLSTKNFTIYFCSTPVNLDSIKSTIQNDYSFDCDDSSIINLVELHVPSSPELPPEMHTTKNLPSNLIPALINAFQMSSSSFSDIMNSIKPDLLIYDVFQRWAPKLASSKGIPSVLFATSSATTVSFYHHLYTMGNDSPFPYKGIFERNPERANVRSWFIELIKDADEDFAFGNFTMSNDIMLIKSSRAVEGKYIDYLSVLCKKQIVPTGPLVNNDHYGDEEKDSEIMKWLSEKNLCSTVYISFGSEYFLSKEQITEIAEGLMLCNVNFLWVIRFPTGGKITSIEEELPTGFLEMVKERGKVTGKWAPQTKILAHPSIGAFASHCGWSSIMESLYYGIPVIAMPMKSDQPLNARFVVEAGVGIEVEKKDVNGHYMREEVANVINKVVLEMGFCEGLKDRAKRLSVKVKENAEQEMNEAAEELLRICMKKIEI